MNMQREDFLKLWKLPELTFVSNTSMGKRIGRTRDGMALHNAFRVIGDWFPHGSIVQIGDTPFISRGPSRSDNWLPHTELRLLSSKTLEEKALSVLEALTLAELMIKQAK